MRETSEVYLDRWDFKELRDAGNDYLMRERSLEGELDRAIKREFGREKEHDLDREKEREIDLDRADWGQISSMFATDQERSHDMDERAFPSRDDRGGGSGEREERDRDDRDLDRGDDFGR
ncbi:MAG: hypothetical protein K8F91_12215 [Candidatus Obscuribacterales bacterium]|nr:hypothetical protein [Candidatus Obscuribacterales bacterium]